jgi:hypothetical protein
MVVVAPAPLKADLDLLLREPSVIGLFTFDPGVTWPDRSGCAYASAYLAAGHAICLQFDALGDAVAAHERLQRETRQPNGAPS